MANPKLSLFELLVIARRMSDDELSARNIRDTANGGGHERVAMALGGHLKSGH